MFPLDLGTALAGSLGLLCGIMAVRVMPSGDADRVSPIWPVDISEIHTQALVLGAR